MANDSQSLWHATHHIRTIDTPGREQTVDVVIIGGGITGLTAAVLLAREGRNVALVEQGRLGAGETGQTTSHLTEAVDGRYQNIRRAFGNEAATRVAKSSRAAIARIEQFARELGDCGFTRVPGYLYAERDTDLKWLAKELDAASRAGCGVEWMDAVPLPFTHAGGIRWTDQAQVHATRYLDLLAGEAQTRGVRIYEQTRATNVHDADSRNALCRVHTSTFDLHAKDVFVAAHVPINNRVLLHTKIAAYRTYVIAMDITGAAGRIPAGLFWDTDDPYHYTRLQQGNGRTYLMVGGEDHRTGVESDTEARYQRLIEYATARFGSLLPISYRWSGQIIEPVDGLPFIGLNSGSEHVYVATGYAGNGMTFGTLAGMIVSDLILGRDNEYADLYAATRVKPIASAFDYVTENVVFPVHLAADRLTSLDVEKRAPEALQPGEGGIFSSEEGKLAICRDRHGALHVRSAVCTHLGCDVAWNNFEQTWDCACHGSRFSPDGKVINGPAVSDLAPARVPTKR